MDSLVATIVVSPAGTRHYHAALRSFGLWVTRCGFGIDTMMGWGRGIGKRDCTRCVDSVR